jgi:hypothetical protein
MPTDYEVREQEFNDGFRKAKETHPNLTIDEFRRKRWRFEGAKGSGMGEEAKGIIGLAVLLVVGVVFWTGYGLFDEITDKLFYMLGYGINASDISFDTRPTDCDWTTTPIGPKGCHYKKLVIETDVNGVKWKRHDEYRPRPFAKTRKITVHWEMVND